MTSLTLRSKVPPNLAGMRLIDYLVQRFTYHGRDRWRELIDEGRVLLNGACCTEAAVVRADDEISYTPHDFDEPPADLGYRVVYEDEWLLGIDKPGNLLVHRAGRSFRNNLMYQLRHARGGSTYPQAGAINRLDRETSGLVLAAKHRAALRTFNALLAGGAVRKEYVAIVHGLVAADRVTLEGAIARDRESAIPWKHHVDEREGKPAITDILSVRPLGQAHSLLRLSPRTGRTHQIRVHCSHIGHPIVGDRLYGRSEAAYLAGNNEMAREGREFHRQALHSLAMSFRHPFTEKNIRIEAPLAGDLEELVERLGSE